MAVESVMEDLEGLRFTADDGVGSSALAESDLESTRVDDLHPMQPQRLEYEQVPGEGLRHTDGFELIDFETEADIIAFRG